MFNPCIMNPNSGHDESPKDLNTANENSSQHFKGDDFREIPLEQNVKFIIEGDGINEVRPVFSEMQNLVKFCNDFEWIEIARWVKFEEDVEEGGSRWSKPHVGTLYLHSLFQLRNLLLKGPVILDVEANSFQIIADLVSDNMVNTGNLAESWHKEIKHLLLRPHYHLDGNHMKDKGLSILTSLADMGCIHPFSKSTSRGNVIRKALFNSTSLASFFANQSVKQWMMVLQQSGMEKITFRVA